LDDLGVKCKDRARAKGWTIRNSLKIHASHAGLGGPISSSQPNRRHVLPFPQTHTGANPLFQSILVEPRSCLQESRLMFITVRTADRKFYNILCRILSLTKIQDQIHFSLSGPYSQKDTEPTNDGFVTLLHQQTRQRIALQECPGL
jgi:hypothetical protein